jgi:hypothetical protein
MVQSDNRVPGALAMALTALCIASFLIPAFIIRPFRYQSPHALSLAIAVKNVAPVLSAATLVALLFVAVKLWGRISLWARIGLAIAVMLGGASAVMTRLNYFEWMFRPIQSAGFVSAGQAHLANKEMVMTVKVGAEARAYPIVQMAYHHIVNDTVAGVPIVVTY